MSDKPYQDQRDRIVAAVREVIISLRPGDDVKAEDVRTLVEQNKKALELFEEIKEKAQSSIDSIHKANAMLEEYTE